jgi:hypothetical protein
MANSLIVRLRARPERVQIDCFEPLAEFPVRRSGFILNLIILARTDLNSWVDTHDLLAMPHPALGRAVVRHKYQDVERVSTQTMDPGAEILARQFPASTRTANEVLDDDRIGVVHEPADEGRLAALDRGEDAQEKKPRSRISEAARISSVSLRTLVSAVLPAAMTTYFTMDRRDHKRMHVKMSPGMVDKTQEQVSRAQTALHREVLDTSA